MQMMLKVNIFFLSFFSLFLCFLFKSTHVGSSTKYIYFNIFSDAAYIKPQVWTIIVTALNVLLYRLNALRLCFKLEAHSTLYIKIKIIFLYVNLYTIFHPFFSSWYPSGSSNRRRIVTHVHLWAQQKGADVVVILKTALPLWQVWLPLAVVSGICSF